MAAFEVDEEDEVGFFGFVVFAGGAFALVAEVVEVGRRHTFFSDLQIFRAGGVRTNRS